MKKLVENIYNIRTLSENITFNCVSFKKRNDLLVSFSLPFRGEYKSILYFLAMYILCLHHNIMHAPFVMLTRKNTLLTFDIMVEFSIWCLQRGACSTCVDCTSLHIRCRVPSDIIRQVDI